MAKGKDLYETVAAANNGVTRNDVRNLFIWYDLLSYALPFQLIFIFIYLVGSNYYPFIMGVVTTGALFITTFGLI